MFVMSARKALMLAALAAAFAFSGRLGLAADPHAGHGPGSHDAPKKADTPATQPAPAYPLTTCPVTDEKLGSMGTPVVHQHEGREVRFCCKGCVKTFEKEPAKFLAKMDKQIVAQEVPKYPLETCVVAGGKLGSMGDPVDYVHNNRLVRFCCKGCIDTFKKDPAKYLKQIDAAKAAKDGAATQPAAPAHGGHGGHGAHGAPGGASAPGATGHGGCGGCGGH